MSYWTHSLFEHLKNEDMKALKHASITAAPTHTLNIFSLSHPSYSCGTVQSFPFPGSSESSKKWNNYRENNNGERGSFLFLTMSKEISEAWHSLNKIQVFSHQEQASSLSSLGNNNKSNIWCPIISNSALHHKISSINFWSGSLKALLKCYGPAILMGGPVVKSQSWK